jgi:hypothetical protein
MLEAFRDDAQGEGLDSGDRLLAAPPVRQCTRKLGNLGNPATIFFALNLDGKTHPDPPDNPAEVGGCFASIMPDYVASQTRCRHEELHRPPDQACASGPAMSRRNYRVFPGDGRRGRPPQSVQDH